MFYQPMLLGTSKSVFSSPNHIFETKYDGIRILYSNVDKPILYTRNRGIVTKQFPELLIQPPPNTILDGEMVVFNEDGKDDFDGIKKRFFMKKEEKIFVYAASLPATYMVFDILHHEGKDLRNLPLLERKSILNNVLVEQKYIHRVSFVDTKGEELFSEIQDKKLEGIVAKQKASKYVGKRSSQWLKMINWLEAEAVITGYRKKDNALLCCHLDLRPLGLVLSGMSPVHREAFFKIARGIKTGEDWEYIHLEPLLRCQVKGRGFTSKGILRSPIFVDFIL
ncbi:ATP-dependent DNA ligase [Alkaliphilus hydrothermalis]|uniref:DNA ligase-1 n=1 Tax=Alkaliphilus hydrothermalis TaxID=1482730 RepID=A0ABS2NS01_9FIRM|nr:hypothetical protein [Alkaliphilus hydrothermalis]MBM7615727.1 DNA ligase-1 [Alkaliphilus hydrothermalis]